MEVKDLKEKLHILIENSTEDTLEYMYSLFEETPYTNEFENVLDEEYDACQKDKSAVTRAEINALVNGLLNT